MSLISDILANIHLILGMGVLLGGFGRVEQHSNVTVVGTYSSLLILSVAGLIFPIASQLLATPRPSGIQSFSQALVVIFFNDLHWPTSLPAENTPHHDCNTVSKNSE